MRALLLMTFLICGLPGSGQEKPATSESGVYRVEFNIHDGSDAAAKAGRRYVLLIEPNEKGVFRVGQKVPYTTGAAQPAAALAANPPMVPMQFNYAEVGVNIECRINDAGGKVRVRASIDLSTVMEYDKSRASVGPMPVIGQLRMEVNSLVSPGKPTMVASIDDPVTMRKFDVEATVTRVN